MHTWLEERLEFCILISRWFLGNKGHLLIGHASPTFDLFFKSYAGSEQVIMGLVVRSAGFRANSRSQCGREGDKYGEKVKLGGPNNLDFLDKQGNGN